MKKGTIILIAASIATFILLGAFVLMSEMNSYSEFAADGYLIDPASTDAKEIEDVGVINFSSGGKYRERYASNVEFTSSDGTSEKVALDRFLHYNDNSLGALTKGVIVDLDNITSENYGYYSVTKNTILVNQNNSYTLNLKGDNLSISEFVWKLSDTQYMLVSPQVKLKIGDANIIFDNYAEITYVDNGIVRISNIDGVYETISDTSNLTTDSGKILSLVGKGFYDDDGNLLLALEGLAIEDSSYTEVDDSDSPSMTIPTFIAQNGEDGDSGTDGETGEDGEDGDVGVEGEQGTSGQNGASGADGATGNTGTLGYDGKNGEGANSTTTVAAADLNAKPEMGLKTTTTTDPTTGETTEAETDYTVASTSATMTLSSSGDTTIVDDQSLKITLYDKDTWTAIKTITGADAKALVDGTTNELSLTYDGLTPDTDYVVVVSGDYEVIKGSGSYVSTTFLTKQFKTTELGITLDKYMVGEDYVSVTTAVTDGDVVSYKLSFYQLDNSDDSKKMWATYVISTGAAIDATSGYQITGTSDTWQAYLQGAVGDTGTKETAGVRTGLYGLDQTVESNATYYAAITDVQVQVGNSTNTVDSSDLIVKLQTLKKAPVACDSYSVDGDGNVTFENNTTYSISDLTPTLTNNTLTHSLTLELPESIYDKDGGVVSYTYQLYTQDNADTQTLKYEKTYTTKQPANFVIDDNDTSIYVGKVVVNFDNNESVVNYSTLFSGSSYLPKLSSQLSMEINYDRPNSNSNVSSYPEKISGQLIIHDPAAQVSYKTTGDSDKTLADCNVTGGVMMQYVKNNNFKVKMQIVGHENLYTLTFDVDNIYYSQTQGYFYMSFIQDGLYHSYYSSGVLMTTYYSLRVYGPFDADSSGSISSQEQETFIDSVSVGMPVTYAVQAVGTNDLNSSDSDFKLVLGFTTAAPTETDATYDSVATYKERAEENKYSAVSCVEEQLDTNAATKTTTMSYEAIDTSLSDQGNYNNNDFYEYEVSTINTVQVSLSAIDEYGRETKLGVETINMDGATDEEGKHNASNFNDSFYKRSSVTMIDDSNTVGLELADGYSGSVTNNAALILTPNSFSAAAAMDRYDSQAWFKITVDSIKDYAGSDIPIDPNHNSYTFKIREKHKVDTSIGDTVVEIKNITRAGANTTYTTTAATDPEKYEGYDQINATDKEISVGMEFYSKYDNLPYDDFLYDNTNIKIVYTVFEIDESWDKTTDELDSGEDAELATVLYDVDYYSTLQTNLGLSDSEFEEKFADYADGTSATYDAIAEQKNYLKKVAVIEADSFNPIQLYYEGTKGYVLDSSRAETPITVYDAQGNTLSNSSTATFGVISRGKRYFVSYVIETSSESRICNSSRITTIKSEISSGTITQSALVSDVKDIYPYCASNSYGYLDSTTKQFTTFKKSGTPVYYDDINGMIPAVPLLRSFIKEDEKITPQAGRYLNTTGSAAGGYYMAYTYFIFDPDQAIPVDSTYTYGAGIDATTKNETTFVQIEEFKPDDSLNRTFYTKMLIPSYSKSYKFKTSYDSTKKGYYTEDTSASAAGQYYTFLKVGGYKGYNEVYSSPSGTGTLTNNVSLIGTYKYRTSIYYATTNYNAYHNEWETETNLTNQYDVYDYPNYGNPTVSNAKAAGTHTSESQSEAVENEGGYRLAIHLRGTSLEKFVAYRVAISNNSTSPYADGAKTVIYDPVYISQTSGSTDYKDDLNDTTGNEKGETLNLDIGQLYDTFIDRSTLQVITKNTDGGNVYVYVTGYYNTNVSGYGDYDSVTQTAWSAQRSYNSLPANNSLAITSAWPSASLENIYALRIGDQTTSYYKNPQKDSEKTSYSTTDNMKYSSVFIPGTAAGSTAGLTVSWNACKTEGVDITYNSLFYWDSIAKSTNATTYLVEDSSPISTFKNGPEDYDSNHVIPQKLATLDFKFKLNTKSDGTNFDVTDFYTLELSEALPAIAQNDNGIARGQRTYTHAVTVSGKASTGAPYIYAMLYDEQTSKYVQVQKQSDGTFAVVKTDNVANENGDLNTYYSSANYSSQYIDQSNANEAKFSVTGLEKSHYYQIVYFTYVDNKIEYLWVTDKEKKSNDYPYEFQTKDKVDLGVGTDPVHYEYLTYTNKYATIDYAVATAGDGRDKGSRIYWALFDGSQIDTSVTSSADGHYSDALISGFTSPLASGKTSKLNEGTDNAYYSNGFGTNPVIKLPMAPGDGASANNGTGSNLEVGKTYCLRIFVSTDASTVPDVTEGDDGHIDIVFTVPLEADNVKHETKYLDDPTATLNVSQKITSERKINLYTDATTVDDMNALIDDTYYLAVFDESNNIVAYKKVTRDTDPTDTDKIKDGAQIKSSFKWLAGNNDDASNSTVLELTSGDEYKIRAIAYIDLDNNKVADTYDTYVGTKHKRTSDFISAAAIDASSNGNFCILTEKIITAKKAITANIECTSATTDTLDLRFSQTQNMTGIIDSILITVNASDGNDVFSREVTVSGSSNESDKYSFIHDYTLADGNTYFITDTDASGNALGDPQSFIIEFSGTDWKEAMADAIEGKSGTQNFTVSFMLLQGGSPVGSDLNTCKFAIKASEVVNNGAVLQTQNEEINNDAIVESEEEINNLGADEEDSDDEEETKEESNQSQSSTETKKEEQSTDSGGN